MTIETLPFEHRPRNSIANNLDKINELVDWINLDTHLYASASGERVTVDDASSVKGLTVDGRSVQDGTPTPDTPVPVQVVDGKNLLDVDSPAIASGKFIMPDGSLTNSASWNVSDYISVTAGEYVLCGAGTGSAVCFAIYDSDKGLVSATSYANRTTIPITVTVVGYIRVCWNNDNVNTAQLERGTTATPYVPYGCIAPYINDTLTAINLQGNVLASLPNGTRDELHIDSAGHVTIDSSLHVWNMRDYADNTNWRKSGAATNGYYLSMSYMNPRPMNQASGASPSGMLCNIALAQNTVNNYYHTLNACIIDSNFNFNLDPTAVGSTLEEFKSWLSIHDVYVVAKLATPQTIDLGYIDPPAIPSGSVVTITASLTPTFNLEWWVDDGITALINDLIAYVDYKTEG